MSDTYSPGRFSFLPVVTKNLLIINTLCYFAMVVAKGTFGFDMNDFFGLHYFRSSHFYPFQFLTYMFMHGNFEHLFFNMFALWMFGSVIENYWGSRRFLFYYLITGIGAAMTHYLVVSVQFGPDVALLKNCIDTVSPENLQALLQQHQFALNARSGEIWMRFTDFQNQLPMLAMQPDNVCLQESIREFLTDYLDYYVSLPNIVGASGSIYGLLLAFGVLFPNDRIYLYFLLPIRAKWFVVIFGLVELASGVLGTSDGVAHFAHLGGMLFGLLLIWMWRRQERQPSYRYEDDFSFAGRGRRAKTDDEFSAEQAAERRKMDEILEKISRSGYEHLTKEEKDFLFRSSHKNTRW
ncbi:MAG: rhomboid family intramembrane serine protease [Bacteroidales bacterium]|nr:rhomboid family intramembrane serine protease [Bacteroidales bacterium]